ncbi:MAG: hypothetical protein Q9162_004306 [Coniocarpon cinnabarinum]
MERYPIKIVPSAPSHCIQPRRPDFENPSDAAPKRSLLDRLRGKETPHQDNSHIDEQPQQPKADLPLTGPVTDDTEKDEALNTLVKQLHAGNMMVQAGGTPSRDDFGAMYLQLERLHSPGGAHNQKTIWKQVQKRYGESHHSHVGITREKRRQDDDTVLLLLLVADAVYYEHFHKFATGIADDDPRRTEALAKFPLKKLK